MDKIILDIKENIEVLNKLILSDSSTDTKKIIAKPISLKSGVKWQIERFKGTQVFHENVQSGELTNLPFADYKQITLEKVGTTTIYSKGKVDYRSKSVKNEQSKTISTHNKEKNYLIKEGDDVPALVDLGVFTRDGKIVKSMYDKFKQINKFIEIIDDAYKTYQKDKITILDFGCGKSYLTFLVYYYFVKIKGVKARIIGYDIKQDVVYNCNNIANKYGYDGLEFVLSDVKKDKLFDGKIDMIITLHACDTATDYALDFAIKNGVKNIFSVPCCQHEVNLSIKKGGDYDILLEDGLIKERFSALLTDSVRVEILRSKGYSVDVIEFVDFAHSPKNLMIRATLNSKQKSLKRVEDLMNKYQFKQTLFELQNK
ncbi:MAG: class I SAM-dependent methyltransferase [Clostridia bacterium]